MNRRAITQLEALEKQTLNTTPTPLTENINVESGPSAVAENEENIVDITMDIPTPANELTEDRLASIEEEREDDDSSIWSDADISITPNEANVE